MTSQISFLPMLDALEKPEPLYVTIERKSKAICDELWAKHGGNVREYVAECVDRFQKESLPWYDLRDDDRAQYDDVVGECFACGKPITAREICDVDAINYSWKRKDGKNIDAYVHYNDTCTQSHVMNTNKFHEAYLRLTGYTDEEYIQNLKKEQPSVFEARVRAGMYDEEGNRLHGEDWCSLTLKDKQKKAKEISRSFITEGWKEVPKEERKNAWNEKNGWIDERSMDAMEPRVGTRYFMIDVKSLTWKCFFKKGAKPCEKFEPRSKK